MGTVPKKTPLFLLLVHITRSHTVEESKACYGTQGNECTRHELDCKGGKIAIQDAFLSYNSTCGGGLSSCSGVVVENLTYMDKRADLNETLTEELYRNCSLKESCKFDAGRNGSEFNFSVLKYICINGDFGVKGSTTITTETTTATTSSTSNATTTSTMAPISGAIAGGVVGVLVVCAVVASVLIWFKFVRNKRKDKKPEKESSNHASLSNTAINEGGSSNYDYATIHDGANPVVCSQNHYALAGKPNTEKGTMLLEDDYNHINHNPPQSASFPGYDTSDSAAAAVKKNASSNCIDDDDYNHLGDGKPSVVSSDYDTTASASKAVAQLGQMQDSEDDYDHFKRSEDRVIDSPYDTANHHISVSADTTSSH